eukprot:914472-Rhodomonas_salina.1
MTDAEEKPAENGTAAPKEAKPEPGAVPGGDPAGRKPALSWTEPEPLTGSAAAKPPENERLLEEVEEAVQLKRGMQVMNELVSVDKDGTLHIRAKVGGRSFVGTAKEVRKERPREGHPQHMRTQPSCIIIGA